MVGKRIAVLTSGGDAAGMNAAVRAVVRGALQRGWAPLGVRDGYAGLLSGDLRPLSSADVAGISHRGGTVLGTARCPALLTDAGRLAAVRQLATHRIDALVVIGGDGSQRGAHALSLLGVPVVGIASTIDNDLVGPDVSLGVDTALNVALEALDRLKVTASSHHRAFLVETMGRNCGYLALMAGLAGGAEAIVIPEREREPEDVAQALRQAYLRGKAHAVVVVAEGAHHNAQRLAAYFREHAERLGFELRVTTLGHIQRGGTPGAFDRLLATRCGAAAIEAIAAGNHGVLTLLHKGAITALPLAEVVAGGRTLDLALLALAEQLAH